MYIIYIDVNQNKNKPDKPISKELLKERLFIINSYQFRIQDQAKADLERLAKIRAQREEAARRRKEEEEAKAAMEARIKEQARLKNKK